SWWLKLSATRWAHSWKRATVHSSSTSHAGHKYPLFALSHLPHSRFSCSLKASSSGTRSHTVLLSVRDAPAVSSTFNFGLRAITRTSGAHTVSRALARLSALWAFSCVGSTAVEGMVMVSPWLSGWVSDAERIVRGTTPEGPRLSR